jgi:hypothetical protein
MTPPRRLREGVYRWIVPRFDQYFMLVENEVSRRPLVSWTIASPTSDIKPQPIT